jgi:hypothetical protein
VAFPCWRGLFGDRKADAGCARCCAETTVASWFQGEGAAIEWPTDRTTYKTTEAFVSEWSLARRLCQKFAKRFASTRLLDRSYRSLTFRRDTKAVRPRERRRIVEATRANKLEVPGGRCFGGERLRAGGTGVSWA